MQPTALDSESRLDSLILALEKAKRIGFESTPGSSPIIVLLDAAVDLCILLANEYGFEEHQNSRQVFVNPSVEFDYSRSDQLGNPVSFKRFIRNKRFEKPPWDPKAKEFFQSLAELLILIRSGKDLPFSFMEKFRNFLDLPANTSQVKNQKKQAKQKKKQSIFFYNRRQANRAKTQAHLIR